MEDLVESARPHLEDVGKSTHERKGKREVKRDIKGEAEGHLGGKEVKKERRGRWT